MKPGLIILFRFLLKNKVFTAVTLVTLTVGLSACFLLMKFVRFEISYDKFYPRSDKVYRISYERFQNGNLAFHSARTMSALAPSIKRDFPEVKNAIRGVYEECLIYIKEDNKYLNNQKVFWADDGFLEVFPLKLLKGDPEKALAEPYTALISESTAYKLFGNKDPVGRTFTHNEGLVFTVSGIFEDIPQNTHLNLNFVYSFVTFSDWPWGQPEGNWRGNWVYTYILADDSFIPELFESDLNARVKTYMPELASNNTNVFFHLQPLKDIHLKSHLANELSTNGDFRTLVILIVVAVVIFLISWFNYINLWVAQIHEQARQIAIRKVLGENRANILIQSLLVILVVNLIAIILSFLAVRLMVPFFYQIFDIQESGIRYSNHTFWVAVLGIIIGVSLVLGLYPALISSRTKLQIIFTGGSRINGRRMDLRKALVIMQFTLSSILIFNVLVLSDQVNFMVKNDLGFNLHDVVLLNAPETWCQTSDSVKSSLVERFSDELLLHSEIKNISACRYAPGSEIMGYLDNVKISGNDQSQENISIQINHIDDNYFKTLSVEYLAGRPFKNDYRMDRNSIIINESAMKSLGIRDPESAINRTLVNNDREFRIIAVVKDYHHQGIKNEIRPAGFIFRYAYDFGYLLVKIQGEPGHSIEIIEKQWESDFPVAILNYRFLEDFYNLQYKPEFRLKKTTLFFTVIALILACIGLFSLLLHSLNSRIREIAIRRTLGAGIHSITLKLLSEFLTLVTISMVIAFAVSYFTANRWLQNFALRTRIDFQVFLLTGTVIITLSFLVIIRHIYTAARRNPVLGLRYE